jgi:hypothetical protein
MTSLMIPRALIVASADTNPTAPSHEISTLVLSRPEWEERGYCIPHGTDHDHIVRVEGRYQRRYAYSRAIPARTPKPARKTQREPVASLTVTIERDLTVAQVYALASLSHRGDTPFMWSNSVARTAILENLTDYRERLESISGGCMRGTSRVMLRQRAEELIDEAYPMFAPGMPEVEVPAIA